jgi:DNA segregation ATPase FtsK/SpoIIIE, S-DNA-T family
MSESPLDRVGLFDPARQHRLLTGVASRNARTGRELTLLREQLNQQEKLELEKLDLRRHDTVGYCREQRREMLQRWDDAEEQLTVTYETQTVQTRAKIDHLATRYRKQLATEKAVIQRKVEARRGAVLQQYENRRNMPGQQMRKEFAQIEDALVPVTEEIQSVRALAIRRLDQLPDVPPSRSPEDDVAEPTPTTVRDAIDAIGRLARHAKVVNAELQAGAASKAVDSFYLPLAVGVFILVWVAVVWLVHPDHMLLWMVASVPVGAIIGFAVYWVLLMPLRRMTRQIYPRSERLFVEAQRCTEVGRAMAKKQADEASAELIHRRDAHLAAAEQWQIEQIAELEKKITALHAQARQELEEHVHGVAETFTSAFNRIGSQMRSDADALAQSINQTLSQTDAENQSRRESLARHHETQLRRLEERLHNGLIHGLQRIELACDRIEERFPDWDRVVAEPLTAATELPCLPVGYFQVEQWLRQSLLPDTPLDDQLSAHAATPPAGHQMASDILQSLPQQMPVALHRRLHSGLIIEAAPQQLDKAIELAQAILWRMFASVAPSRAKLILIDPIGRGQNFAGLMSMTDHEPDLVGHRVWTGERQIEQRLAELAHHVEDILQVNLRDRFERIEEYNQIAGSLAEPYRAIAAVGFPENLTRDGYKSLRAILDSSLRCGIWTIMVCDTSRPWTPEMPLPADRRLMRLSVDQHDRWSHGASGLNDLPFTPVPSPPAAHKPELIRRVGTAAVQAARVEVPFIRLMQSSSDAKASQNGDPPRIIPLPPGDHNSDLGLEIPIGVQGAGRLQALRLGEGVKQHVLTAGKTGSGKSSLLHTLITAGAAHYRPDQLQFYLLDFKKGVEFKVYADAPLPHARVIGIESEREFGRSVLQRLDADMQQRGERFRGAGVQDLAEYRGQTGQSMPRIMLVVDEFQELFVRDDSLAADCAMLLDRLVRQGRSFGMHVVLSSQSLAGAHSLPRATLGQMAVRIALQCSESDAAMILGDDNVAAKFISRPGEAIYNDAGGLLEGNQPFQIAYLGYELHRDWLARIAARDSHRVMELPPRMVFEGNRPCRWEPELAVAAIASNGALKRLTPAAEDHSAPVAQTRGAGESSVEISAQAAGVISGLLGEAVEIGPPASLQLPRQSGRNVLIVAPPESTSGLLASVLSGLAASAQHCYGSIELFLFDGHPNDQASLSSWLSDSGITATITKPRQSESLLASIAERMRQRIADDATDEPPIVIVIDPLNRFSDLRQDDSFSFSLDAAAGPSGPAALQEILRDGPEVGIFTILCCSAAETLSRWLPRQSRHDLQQRIIGRVNASDSASLIDSSEAAGLSAATMLLYDDADGSVRKFRTCDLPPAEAVRDWLSSV